jgi:Bacterial protein of unknown function (DUF839)
MHRRRLAALAVPLVAAAATPALANAPADVPPMGPSTTTPPYLVPAADGVHLTSLLTVDDGAASNGYEMDGTPDGLGAHRSGRNHFTLFMNHEFNAQTGTVRRHGQRGAYVSTFTIDRRDLEVETGEDTIAPGVQYWDYVTQRYQATASTGGTNPRQPGDQFLAQGNPFSRFCSATLSARRQFESRESDRGYSGRIYFGNEENGNEGRAFGVLEDGTTQQLPRLGLFSWENTLPAYNRSDTTTTIGNEDTAFGQLRVYEGVKRRRGNPFDRAGLTNGVTSVLDVLDETVRTDREFRTKYGKGVPVEFDLAEVDWDQSGLRQQVEAAADGLTLNRIEDGAWDPKHPDDFYFVTTEGGGTASADPAIPRDGGGLWKLTFEDIEHPSLGGTIELLLDGSEAPYLNKPDNVTLDRDGNLLIQEDAGNNAHVSRIVAYDTRSGARGVVATFDPERFARGGSRFLTDNEESSGIIDAAHVLGRGWFLFDAAVHAPAADPAHVELGQLLAMKVDDFDEVYDRH